MSELRQNPITRDWVIVATERAKRPHDFIKPHATSDPLPTYDPKCPFCQGNEDKTGVETYRLSDRRGWRVRAVLNKYPALRSDTELTRKIDSLNRSISGVGVHEVIIEHPEHNAIIPLLELDDIVNIITVYRDRYYAIRQDHRIETIIVFKNHGSTAGTSLAHPHSQIAATPVVPAQLRHRLSEAIRYFDDNGECLMCRSIAEELANGTRVILSTKHFITFIPYAALSPFHIWIFPRRHASSFDEITDIEIIDLAYTLKTILGKLYFGLNNPDYNYTIRSVPTSSGETDYFHWYLAIVPRVSQAAGFELGSGMFINTALPEDSAHFLRSIEILP